MRKLTITIIAILGIMALGAGVYFAWKQSQTILNPPTVSQLPVVANQKFGQVSSQTPGAGGSSASIMTSGSSLKVISSDAVFDYWVVGPSSSPRIYYLNQEGKIMMTGISGTAGGDKIVAPNTFSDLQSVKASPDGEYAVIKSGDLANPQFTIWNIDNKSTITLTNATAAAFSPDSKKLAYFRKSPSKSSVDLLVKSLTARTKDQRVLSVNENDFDLSWILPQQIILIPKPSFDDFSQVWSFNLTNSKLSLLGSGKGLMINWSTDGRYGIIFSVSQNNNQNLNLIKPDGTAIGILDFSTPPNKCYLSPLKLYCALPQSYASVGQPILPDDYLKRAVYSNDYLYSVDANTSIFQPLYLSKNLVIDAVHLQVSGDRLLFINRYDNKLYSLGL